MQGCASAVIYITPVGACDHEDLACKRGAEECVRWFVHTRE